MHRREGETKAKLFYLKFKFLKLSKKNYFFIKIKNATFDAFYDYSIGYINESIKFLFTLYLTILQKKNLIEQNFGIYC